MKKNNFSGIKFFLTIGLILIGFFVFSFFKNYSVKKEKLWDQLPDSSKEKFSHVLKFVFNQEIPENILLLEESAYNTIYKIKIGNKEYALILINPVQSNEQVHYQIANYMIGAALGLGPKIYYSDFKERTLVIEYLENINKQSSNEANIKAYAQSLKTLHSGPPLQFDDTIFKKIGGLYLTACDELPAYKEFFQGVSNAVRSIELLLDHREFQRPTNRTLMQVYASEKAESKLKFLNWSLAGQDNFFIDLAVAALLFTKNQDEEKIFLETYFGASLQEKEEAIFFLMKQVVLVWYAFELLVSNGEVFPETLTHLKSFSEGFKEKNQLNFKDPVQKERKIGLVLLNQVVHNVNSTTFFESMNQAKK